MFSRREFGKYVSMALAARASGLHVLAGQVQAGVNGAGPEFSVMIWVLRKLGTFEENLQRVADAGFRHIELVAEFGAWSEEDWKRILAKMQALKITVDSTTGVKSGFADLNGGDKFISDLKDLIPTMKRLGCGQAILMSGKRVDGAPAGAQKAAAIETLKRTAEALDAAGVSAVIEPIDHLENPPIYLDGVTEAFEIVRAVGSPRVKVLYDLYHEQRGYGNLIEKLEKNIDQVGLVHVADVPGRHEPGTGEMNYINIYKKLAELRYKGMIAMEFYPSGDIVQGLKRAREEAIQSLR